MGVQTVMLVAVLFASKEIKWVADGEWWQTKQTGLIVSIILIQLIAVGGAYVMSKWSKKYGNLKTLMVAAVIWIICTIIAYMITLPQEFYLTAVLVGFVMGGTQSLSRSTYSKMLPPTEDSASYFSFFDVMEKVGLIFGPLMFGVLEGVFGNMRMSILMLMVFFIFGFLLLSGNAYILKVGSDQGTPKELHLLRPDRMNIKGGSKPIPDRYEYTINVRIQATYPVEEATGFSEVNHIKLSIQLDDYYVL